SESMCCRPPGAQAASEKGTLIEGGSMLTSAHRKRKAAPVIALIAGLAITSTTLATVGGGPDWGMIGNDSANSRNQPFEHDIGPASPSRAGNTLVVGDLKAPNMLGIDATTGELRWITQVHPDPHGIMTGSPVLAGDTIYTGVSASGASNPVTATFRGAIVALN